MPVDPDETADQRARRRELEAAGQLGLPEDALGLDEDEELLDDDEPAGAVTTEGRRVSWRPRPPQPPVVNPKPPTEPIKPPPITGSGKVVEVRKASDLKAIKSNTTYQWVGGYKHREQVALNGLNNVTFIDPWIEGAHESNIYARNFNVLTITGGNLSGSKTKSGLLVDGDSQGLRVIRCFGEGNGEHFLYYGAHKKGGTPFYIEDCTGKNNDRCGFQCNLEGRDWWVVGGRILNCTFDGNASEQGSQCNLGACDGLLFEGNTIINGQDDGVILCAIDGKASKNCRIVSCTFRDNDDAPLKAVDGSKGHTLSKCVFDEMPTMSGIKSDKTNVCKGKQF